VKLVLSNTLARHKQEFVPLVPGRASLYTCGPTVHDYAHVGNFRTFTVYDVLRRTLRRSGYAVEQLMNLTDVEDRIIAKAGKAGVSIQEYTAPYIAAFHQHRQALRIEDAERYPLATEHIPEMVELIAALERKGHTYRADGSVYFRISSFPGYGKLSQKDLAGQRTGVRVDADDYDKEEALDFVLWKAAKPGEPSWDTPFGPGRPGWHIECSAMAMRYLGPSFDIHTGGVDLIFPHHENEIAQSEGATGLPFARIWLHAAFLNVQGDKMSKRKGNFFTLQDLLEDGVDPRALRYAYLGTHYKKPMNYSDETIAHAAAALTRIDNTIARLDSEARADAAPGALAAAIARAAAGFEAAIGDDLNTPRRSPRSTAC
jgi:cysteinyl-tRNA synthetase